MKRDETIRRKILEFLRQNHEKATMETAEALGLSHSKVVYHLRMLAVEGKVRRRLASPRVALWRVVEEGE